MHFSSFMSFEYIFLFHNFLRAVCGFLKKKINIVFEKKSEEKTKKMKCEKK